MTFPGQLKLLRRREGKKGGLLRSKMKEGQKKRAMDAGKEE